MKKLLGIPSITGIPSINFCIFGITLVLLMLPLLPFVAADEIDVHCQNSLSGVETCIKDIAIQRNDMKICDRIETDAMRGSCYGAFAKTLNDIELCKKIPKDARGADARNKCFLKFVKGPEELHVCTDLIHEERAKDDCFSAVHEKLRDDPSMCVNFASGNKRLNCYLKIIKHLDNPGLCQMILDEGKTKRKSQCRYCEVEGVDYGAEFQNCKKDFYLKKIENLCNVHDKQMELKMTKGEKNELSFSGEDSTRDRFWLTFHWAVIEGPFESHTATIRYTDGVRNEAFDNLVIGQSVRGAENDISVQLIDLWTETEGGGDEDARLEKIAYANICVFRPSTRQKEEAGSSRDEQINREEFEEEQERRKRELQKEIEEQQQRAQQEEAEGGSSDATDDENSDNNKDASNTPNKNGENNGQSKSRVKVREGGVFARLISFFKNLFL